MDEQNVDRLAGLVSWVPTPPDDSVIEHWFFTDDPHADDAYQLMACIRFHEYEVDDYAEWLWDGDREIREAFPSLDAFREAVAEAAGRDGPRRLLETLVARYPVRARRLLRRLPKLNSEFPGSGVKVLADETKNLRKIAMRARLPHGVIRCRGSRRRGAGRPGHRSRQRANAPPEGDDPAEPEPDPAARRPQRRVLCVWGWWR